MKAVLLLAALLLTVAPRSVVAQVFLASQPHSPFAIGPLFISAAVGPDIVGDDAYPVTMTISWGLVPRSSGGAGVVPQDLFLLWPGEAVIDPHQGPHDAAVRRYLEQRGFTVLGEGRVPLTVRDRSQMGTPAPPTLLDVSAAIATFERSGAAGQVDVATYVKIPWTPRLADSQSLVRLTLKLRDLVTRHRTSWIEEAFWNRRYQVGVSFGDVGRLSLYPLYFEHRDRVVPLAQDFLMLLVNFGDAKHLKIDQVSPPSAVRRPSQTREATELVSLHLSAAEGITPQSLRVQFSYFSGHLPWQPILISGLFLALGNITGPLVMAIVRRLLRTLRARVHIGRREGNAPKRGQGTFLSREQLARVVPGETTYDEVLGICGSDVEEHERLAASGTRTLVYRGRRLVPHRRMTVGWVAAVDRWDVEQQEVEIDLEADRVTDVKAHVRRYRRAEPEAARV
jgi:hypothetical protein